MGRDFSCCVLETRFERVDSNAVINQAILRRHVNGHKKSMKYGIRGQQANRFCKEGFLRDPLELKKILRV